MDTDYLKKNQNYFPCKHSISNLNFQEEYIIRVPDIFLKIFKHCKKYNSDILIKKEKHIDKDNKIKVYSYI